jgi:amyloid beta precursor protein binding protein 1
VPYPILILQYLQQWQCDHDGSLPTSYAQRKEVKALIAQGVRLRKDGLGPEDEQNFSEAQAACNTALLAPEVGRALFNPVAMDAPF